MASNYRTGWEWTDVGVEDAIKRLERWRWAMSGTGGTSADGTLAESRAALADDLDAPHALAAVDAWCDRALVPSPHSEEDLGAPGVLSRAVNALLGVRL